MDLKTYQAYTMAEALAAVKRDLGADAVILNTRSYRRGGVLGVGRKTIVEVTATTAATAKKNSRAGAPQGRPLPNTRSRIAAQAYSGQAESSNQPLPLASNETAPTAQDRLKTQRLAQAMLEQQERRQRESELPLAVGARAHPREKPAAIGESAAPAFQAATMHAPAPEMNRSNESTTAQRFILRTPIAAHPSVASGPVDRDPSVESTAPRSANASEASREAAQSSLAESANMISWFGDDIIPPSLDAALAREGLAMRDELAAIRQMVGTVLQQTSDRTSRKPPVAGSQFASRDSQLFEMYLALIGQEVSEELADRIIEDVQEELGEAGVEDEAALGEAVRRHLAESIPVAEEASPKRHGDGRPLTIALVGPTGVGKTTTLAKLAASYKLRHRVRVGLITADTYRIAAVDQLRTYANIIGLPLQVVLTPGEMKQAVHALRDCDVILIDTAGRSQNDAGRLAELRRFMDAAAPHEIHLVLSSTASERVLLREAEAFSAVGVDKVLLTKLDEAVSFGVLFNVVRQLGKELSFFTTGQEVPDHLEASRAERLAELLLKPLERCSAVAEGAPA